MRLLTCAVLATAVAAPATAQLQPYGVNGFGQVMAQLIDEDGDPIVSQVSMPDPLGPILVPGNFISFRQQLFVSSTLESWWERNGEYSQLRAFQINLEDDDDFAARYDDLVADLESLGWTNVASPAAVAMAAGDDTPPLTVDLEREIRAPDGTLIKKHYVHLETPKKPGEGSINHHRRHERVLGELFARGWRIAPITGGGG